MELVQELKAMSTMGTAYWIAAAAVALGCTLLVTAGVLHWRRLRARRVFAPRPAATAVSAVREYAAQAVSSPAATPAAPPRQAVDPALMARLHAATARLEALHESMAAAGQLPPGSGLKPAASHVEYVFRSGTA